MSSIINVLPDSIANQIAAGEVIQRPASVVKELVENAVDANADTIRINIKDAGRSLIQVCDNGKGMSEMDARMAFERHATSKITSAQDLFALKTMGFRGEALASIASVAQVELKTKQADSQTGTLVQLSASRIEKHEPVGIANGTTFSIKNLFFNIPARRKFLKSNETEFKNILTEFERIALVNPEITFSLTHNDAEVLDLPSSSIKQRIVNIFGKKLSQQLIPVNAKTSLVDISGFVGNPESAKKRGAFQYFFVNGRYMRHPYFHKAIALAFEPFIPAGFQANYFIYLTVNPESIDVNIHPTKTEIKFENEQALWHIISTAIKESLAVPSLEFDRDGAFEMPVYTKDKPQAEMPKIQVRADYNPFKEYDRPANRTTSSANWEKLYENPSSMEDIPELPSDAQAKPLFEKEELLPDKEHFRDLLSYRGRYIITTLKSGLTIIDQRRAHIRILFDQYISRISKQQGISQGLLFPEIISFTPRQATVLPYLLEDFSFMGFDLSDLGSNSYSINGIPQGLDNIDVVEVLQDMVDKVLDTGCEVKEEVVETLALSLAKSAAIPYGKALNEEEAMDIVVKLFLSASPNYTPDGKLIISILSENELQSKFK